LLKDRHLKVLHKADLGHLKDFKIKSNISCSLGCFLMYHIDPTSMILNLGGNKKLRSLLKWSHLQVIFPPSW
jgi:hypothetical protein